MRNFTTLHEAKLSAVLKISSSWYSKQVRVFENKTRTISLLAIDLQWQLAIDLEWLPARPVLMTKQLNELKKKK